MYSRVVQFLHTKTLKNREASSPSYEPCVATLVKRGLHNHTFCFEHSISALQQLNFSIKYV